MQPSPAYAAPAAHNRVYTKAAAAWLLSIDPSAIAEVTVADCGALVEVEGDAYPRLVPVAEFVRAYGGMRRDRAATCEIVAREADSDGVGYLVRSGQQQHARRVVASHAGIACTCPDYRAGLEIFEGRHSTCKHQQAVLSTLGYGSLREYLVSVRDGALARLGERLNTHGHAGAGKARDYDREFAERQERMTVGAA